MYQKNVSPQLTRIERWVPGVRTLRTYKSAWLPRDLVSGAVLCALLVPQGMAYAELAGLPAITGLYTTVVCLLAYAAFGPSPYLILGPDLSLGPMIAAAILPLAAGNTEYAVAQAIRLFCRCRRVDPGTFSLPEELISNQSLDSGSRHALLVPHPGFETLGATRADRKWLEGLITRREKPENFKQALERQPDDIKVVIQFVEV